MVYAIANDVVIFRHEATPPGVMAESERRVPPSRRKYDAAHPVVSFRVSQQDRERLDALSRKRGVSLARLLHEGLGLMTVHQDRIEKAWDEGYEAGLQQVVVPCPGCGQEYTLDLQDWPTILSAIRLEVGRLDDCKTDRR